MRIAQVPRQENIEDVCLNIQLSVAPRGVPFTVWNGPLGGQVGTPKSADCGGNLLLDSVLVEELIIIDIPLRNC